jgi:glucose-6-phosphate isomerase
MEPDAPVCYREPIMSDSVTQDISGCFTASDGAGGGVDPARFADAKARAGDAARRLARQQAEGRAPAFVPLAHARQDLQPVASLAARFRGAFSDVLLLGTGGSSLGGRAVAALADRGVGPPPGAPKVHFLDNVDPDTFEALFARLDPAATGVFAISKSGGTAETLCQLAVVLDWLRGHLGADALARHAAVKTEAKDSPLAGLADAHGLARLDHDADLGGRFSVLSTAALPAMLLGLDAAALRAGAQAANAATLEADDPAAGPAAEGAALQVALAEQGVSQSVVMPYCDRLVWFARWYRQLWAESLGKQGRGTTPIDALGTVDQHSQLQLYLDGPKDKLFTLIHLSTAGTGATVPADLAGADGLDYLRARTMGDLFDAEARATADSLLAHGRPVRTLTLRQLDERALGELVQQFMLETALAADLMGVDAYDQPAVEDGKQRTKAYMRGAAGTGS